MVVLILLATAVGAFCGGFYCGKKFGSLEAMFDRMKASLSDRLR